MSLLPLVVVKTLKCPWTKRGNRAPPARFESTRDTAASTTTVFFVVASLGCESQNSKEHLFWEAPLFLLLINAQSRVDKMSCLFFCVWVDGRC